MSFSKILFSVVDLRNVKSETWAKLYGSTLLIGGLTGSVDAIYNKTIPNQDDYTTGIYGFTTGVFKVLWAPVIIPTYLVAKACENKKTKLKAKEEKREIDEELIRKLGPLNKNYKKN
jgi:hypothetical protein